MMRRLPGEHVAPGRTMMLPANLTSCIRLHVTHTWPPNSPDLDPTKQQVRFMEASTLQPNILVPDPTAHLQRSDWSGLGSKGDQHKIKQVVIILWPTGVNLATPFSSLCFCSVFFTV